MGFDAHLGWERALGGGTGRATSGRSGEKESHGLAPGPALVEQYGQLLVFRIQDGSRLSVWGGGHCLGFVGYKVPVDICLLAEGPQAIGYRCGAQREDCAKRVWSQEWGKC